MHDQVFKLLSSIRQNLQLKFTNNTNQLQTCITTYNIPKHQPQSITINSITNQHMYTNSGSDFYSSQNSQAQIFQKLKQNIQRLKGQRQQLRGAMHVDRNDLNNVQMAMNQLNRQLQQRANSVREREKKLMEIQRAINQTEKSYNIIVDTTTKLSSALQSEANYLRNLSKK